MKLLKSTLLLSFTLVVSNSIWSQGGMWPMNDIQNRAKDMKESGLKINVDDIYNENQAALNDAVVLFGGGCTGEIVSKEGLLFTNHHCGYSYGQSLSTTDRNILIDGFWAKNNSEELPCPGLSVKFVKQTIDVTSSILQGTQDITDEAIRNKIIQANIAAYEKGYKKISNNEVQVKSYYDGNQYLATVYEVYNDVRMVGFPPNGIGKFGGDTDNWMWPRHTGDFAVFRVYANKKNEPAAYSKDNIPYKPKKYFSIQTNGVKEGEFSMVYGFPARTTQFYTSEQVALTQEILDPIRVNARSAKLSVWDKYMRADKEVFLKYAAKQSSIANGWKKWQGEIRGLELNDVIGKKKKVEAGFQRYADLSNEKYKNTLAEIDGTLASNKGIIASNEIINETVLGVEAIAQNAILYRLFNLYKNDTLSEDNKNKELTAIKKSISNFHKNYEIIVDKNTFDTLMPIYMQSVAYGAVPDIVNNEYNKLGKNFTAWNNMVFQNAIITNEAKAIAFVDNYKNEDSLILLKDPAYKIYKAVIDYRETKIKPSYIAYNNKMSALSREYTKGLMESGVEKKVYYPDANQTLRLTYGPVKGITPFGSNTYSYMTSIDEVIQKTNPNVEEYNTPKKLIDLYEKKDFGRWATFNGTVPVAFIAQNHTSGGNSGSPVLNAKGELIGINFDRIWDGTMSDIYYDPNLCRNISVDIRYVMFIIEKFGNASWLFKEMDLKK